MTKDSWKLIKVRLWRLMIAPKPMEMPAAVLSPFTEPAIPAESIAPVAVCTIRCSSAAWVKVIWLTCPKLNGCSISAGLPLVRITLPARTSGLEPLGIREASIASIGCTVSAKASIRARSSASNAFWELYPFSHTPRPQKRLGTTSQGKATIGRSPIM